MCDWDPDWENTSAFSWHSWTFSGPVPSQNQLKGNTRTNFKYRNWKKKFAAQCPFKAAKLSKAAKGTKRVGVITRYYGKRCRPYDLENFIGGLKPLIDVLKTYGIIYDDNQTHWRGYYFQAPSNSDTSYLTIELREV